MDNLCIRCKGKGLCGKHCHILDRFMNLAPKLKLHFSGKSSPEIFVGRAGYPHINSGILAPMGESNLSNFVTAKEWSANNFSIENILHVRSQLIYGKSVMDIKSPSKLKKIVQELALSTKPVSTEFFLKRKPQLEFTPDDVFRPITNPAPVKKVVLEENPWVPKKVDYLASDYDVKASTAVTELHKAGIGIEHLQRMLSVGLLGVKAGRKMVPTRWSITATDDIISKQQLKKIRDYPEINQIKVFSGNFLGNYIEVLLLPGRFSFEALEVWLSENFYAGGETHFSQDYEGFFGRKSYASNVTGGYYAMRFPLTEYLEKIKRQATALIVREIRPEYYAPLGVGIVRETTRRAFSGPAKTFNSIGEALTDVQSRIRIPVSNIKEKSLILREYGKQKSLKGFL